MSDEHVSPAWRALRLKGIERELDTLAGYIQYAETAKAATSHTAMRRYWSAKIAAYNKLVDDLLSERARLTKSD